MTDQELVQGIIGRDQAVFREFVEAYQQSVIRTCYSLVHDLDDAEDLAQEVFIEIMRSAGSFRGKAKLSSWIYRIAVNKSLNHLKKDRRKQILSRISFQDRLTRDSNPGLPSENNPERGDIRLEEKELKQALHTAINRLPANQRIAFTLHRYEELAYKEIAEVMDVSLSSVESLIHRAKQNLRKMLNQFYQTTLM